LVDYLKITSLAGQRVESELVRWQVSHDFVELGDTWTATRKIRIFLSGPSLKGDFGAAGSAAYYPDGLEGSPSPPGSAGCEQRYDGFWNTGLDEAWSRISRTEFDEHYADSAILDRLSALTALEDTANVSERAVYSHWRTEFSSPEMFFPTDVFDENIDGRVVRRVEKFKNGVLLRDNLYIQRRREFSIVYFNGSIAEGEPYTPDFDRGDLSLSKIDREQFEQLYKTAAPKIDFSLLEETT